MTDRLERALIAVARRYAPNLVPANWQAAGDYPAPLPDLARSLAGNGAMVLMGDLAPGATQSSAPIYFREWADDYTRLYGVLCGALFPSFTEVSGFFIDQEQPPAVVVVGAATPVIEALATLIAPYVVMRQGAAALTVSADELNTVVRVVLDELEAADLAPDVSTRLQAECASALHMLLTTQVRQFALIPASRDLFTPPAAPSTPDSAPSTPPPPTLPETGTLPPLPPTLPR